MRKLFAVGAAVWALAVVGAEPAFAAPPQASERACMGGFHSEAAKALGGLGEVAVYLAGAYHPLGQTVSYEATTCDILFD